MKNFKFKKGQRVVVGNKRKVGTIIDYVPFKNKHGKITQMRYLVDYDIKTKANRLKQVYESQIKPLQDIRTIHY